MRRPVLYLAAVVAALSAAPATLPGGMAVSASGVEPDEVDWTSAPVRLLMVEAPGCIYCEAWQREIGPGYPKSTEGKTAPLLVTDLDGPWPDGIALQRRPTITPTFILLDQGKEVSRLEGYPGDRFFYPLIEQMLTAAGLHSAEGRDEG
ncbi:SoxS protein [Paracoccus salsus]|uniref:SoxS protein n=1 Tax=Paracoccus salsus TaxID=2911061 RepID=UPI001F266F9F|nr:SoxS protein [Paracoccus salsus]MCF3973692.1 SoxS protein [Paracoccus salsus]